MLRMDAPWVAYEVEREERFWKADRPTPRRADMAMLTLLTAIIIWQAESCRNGVSKGFTIGLT